MNLLNTIKFLFGVKNKEYKPVEKPVKSLNRLQGSYESYHGHFEKLKQSESKKKNIEDVVVGLAIDSVFDSLSSNNDSRSSGSNYDSDSSSGFSGGFGGGDYSGGGSSGDWGSSSDSSSYDSGGSDSYSSND